MAQNIASKLQFGPFFLAERLGLLNAREAHYHWVYAELFKSANLLR